MRKILTLLIAVTLCFGFCSCQWESTTEDFKSERFFTIDGNQCTTIYVDKETRVMYLLVDITYGGGLTVMVDESGKPLLWEGEMPNG